MKIVHTADWHLGKIVNEFSMLEDQEYFLDQLIEKLKTMDADVLIMAGDLYDRAFPPKEAVALANKTFTRIIKEVGIPVLAIAGNHDSNERVEYGAQLLEASDLFIEGTIKPVTRKVTIQGVHFWMMPFSDPVYIRKLLNDDSIHDLEDATRVQIELIKEQMNLEEVNVLIAHGYVVNGGLESVETSDSERPLSIGTAEYVPVELFEDFDYVALGHLHKAQKVKWENVRYSGSPLKYSKSETRHKKQLLHVSLDKNGVEVEPFELETKRDMRIVKGFFADLMEQASEDYIFFELLDEDYQMDAMNQLKKRYPYAMGLEYVARQNRQSDAPVLTQEAIEERNLPDLFADFYARYTDRELDEARKQVVASLMDELERSERT